MTRSCWLLLMTLLAVGCSSSVGETIDCHVGGLANRRVDIEPARALVAGNRGKLLEVKSETASEEAALSESIVVDQNLRPAVYQEAGKQPTPPGKDIRDLLQVPPGLPGAGVADVKMPGVNEPREKFEEALKKYFPALPPLAAFELPPPGPEGRPLGLMDFQRLAALNNPQVRQAAADVEAARGAALQAGLPPNPQVGYEGTDIGVGRMPGMQGGYVQQTIVTAGKLKLAQLAALMQLRAAEHRLRGSEADLQTQVRQSFFNILSAQENLRVQLALSKLTDQMYELLLLQMRGGIVSPYEVYSLRVLAQQTRANVVQSRIRFDSTWKQLGNTIGQPQRPPVALAGSIDMPIPIYDQDAVLRRVLDNHSEIQAAFAALAKAQHQLKLAQAMPAPDVDVRVSVMRDFNAPPFGATSGVQVNVPLPLWNRNQGNIHQAQAELSKAADEIRRVELALRTKVQDARERYETNRAQLELYRDHILPNQVLAFRGLVARYAAEADKGTVNYNDLVSSEQMLGSVIGTYLSKLREQWDAVIDIAALLQTDDLFHQVDTETVAPVPCLDGLVPGVENSGMPRPVARLLPPRL